VEDYKYELRRDNAVIATGRIQLDDPPSPGDTLSLGGVEQGQPATFVERAEAKIPLGRMARPDDFQGALVYLCSDAASFVNGANVVVDGGKTIW